LAKEYFLGYTQEVLGMRRFVTAVVVVLGVLVVAPVSLADTESIEFTCDDVCVWQESLALIEVLDLLCTIQDVADPVNMVLVDETFLEEELQESSGSCGELSEESRERLILLLALWNFE
jgi:hypothetical protein